MLLNPERKASRASIIDLVNNIEIPKEYCDRQESMLFSVLVNNEEYPLFMPELFSVGGCLVVGNRDGNKGATCKAYAGALQNKKNRKEIKEINEAYDDFYLRKAAYYQYNFKLNVNAKTAKKIQAVVFCRLLDILKPSVVIVFGSLSYLAKKEFEDIAKKIWPELKNAPNGEVLKSRYNVQGLKEPDEVKKERELIEVRRLLNELGHAIANVHDIFEFVNNEVDSDTKEDYFEKKDFFDGETCEQKLDSQFILINQWGKLRTKKYRLEKGEKANEIIENVKTMCKLTEFLYKAEKVLPYSDVKSAISYIKWIQENRLICDDEHFYELLECALDENKIPSAEIKACLRSKPPKAKQSGFPKTLDAIYEFLVTVTTPRNVRYANLMEHSFVKQKGVLGLQDSSKWKDENGCWKKGVEFWRPKPELRKKKVEWWHESWHHFLEGN